MGWDGRGRDKESQRIKRGDDKESNSSDTQHNMKHGGKEMIKRRMKWNQREEWKETGGDGRNVKNKEGMKMRASSVPSDEEDVKSKGIKDYGREKIEEDGSQTQRKSQKEERG